MVGLLVIDFWVFIAPQSNDWHFLLDTETTLWDIPHEPPSVPKTWTFIQSNIPNIGKANSSSMRVNSAYTCSKRKQWTKVTYLSLFQLQVSLNPIHPSLQRRYCWSPSTWHQTRQQHSMTHPPWKEPLPWWVCPSHGGLRANKQQKNNTTPMAVPLVCFSKIWMEDRRWMVEGLGVKVLVFVFFFVCDFVWLCSRLFWQVLVLCFGKKGCDRCNQEKTTHDPSWWLNHPGFSVAK